MIEAVCDIMDRPYGKREARVRDPIGHFWMRTTTIEQLEPPEIEKGLNA